MLDLRLERIFWVSLASFVVTAVTVFVARSYGIVSEEGEEDDEEEQRP